jgi:hypothetical protein
MKVPSYKKLATKGPSKRRSEVLIMAALEHLKGAGEVKATVLAEIIGCSKKTVQSNGVMNFNTMLAELRVPWRFRIRGGTGGQPVYWSVESKA